MEELREKIAHDCFCNVMRWECERCGHLKCYCLTHKEWSTDHCLCKAALAKEGG